MEFLCCHRDRPGSAALRDELVAQHWSYMDRYAPRIVASVVALLAEDSAIAATLGLYATSWLVAAGTVFVVETSTGTRHDR